MRKELPELEQALVDALVGIVERDKPIKAEYEGDEYYQGDLANLVVPELVKRTRCDFSVDSELYCPRKYLIDTLRDIVEKFECITHHMPCDNNGGTVEEQNRERAEQVKAWSDGMTGKLRLSDEARIVGVLN